MMTLLRAAVAALPQLVEQLQTAGRCRRRSTTSWRGPLPMPRDGIRNSRPSPRRVMCTRRLPEAPPAEPGTGRACLDGGCRVAAVRSPWWARRRHRPRVLSPGNWRLPPSMRHRSPPSRLTPKRPTPPEPMTRAGRRRWIRCCTRSTATRRPIISSRSANTCASAAGIRRRTTCRRRYTARSIR